MINEELFTYLFEVIYISRACARVQFACCKVEMSDVGIKQFLKTSLKMAEYY